MLIIVTLCSCSVNKNLTGKYIAEGKDFKQMLILNKNNTFDLTEQGFEYNSDCTGKWKFISKDTILLKCDSEKSISAMLQSGYMSERKRKAIILNARQIKLKTVILLKSEK